MTRNTDPSPATVQLVRDRDADSCVRCGNPYFLTTQHRVARGMGGSRTPWINSPSNLLTLCGSGTTGCHGWVEHHPLEARRLGWALSRFTNHPEDEPAWYPLLGGWFLLTMEGTLYALGRHAGSSGGGGGVPVDHPHLGAAVPDGAAEARELAPPFPV